MRRADFLPNVSPLRAPLTMYRGLRAVLALVCAVLVVGVAIFPWPRTVISWRPLVALVVFVAYSAYIWLAHDERDGPGVPWWEMILLGGACGASIGYLLGLTTVAAAAGLAIGLVLGLFADKWTGFVKHL